MSKFKLSNVLPLLFFFLLMALFIGMSKANATKPPPPPKPEPQGQTQDQHQGQHQGQAQDQRQGQDQGQSQEAHSASDSSSVSESYSESFSDAASAANNEGNSLSVESNYESGPADLVLVPNNNTERCLRVFGFSFGNKEGSGMLGVPWRSKQCDYKGFASDADAQGNFDLGWFWRCHMKSAYKVFRDKGETVESAIDDCVTKNSGTNFLVDKVAKQKDEYNALKREHEAALMIIDERDKEALRLKNEVAEKRLIEAVGK